MKKIIILFILIFTPAAMAANKPVIDSEPAQQEEKAKPVPVIEEKASEKAQRDEHWPRPFVPSEQIGADSVVSFPADI
jgi:hypothetical protein